MVWQPYIADMEKGDSDDVLRPDDPLEEADRLGEIADALISAYIATKAYGDPILRELVRTALIHVGRRLAADQTEKRSY